MNDQIDRAIAAANPPPSEPIQLTITVGTPPRPIIMVVPSDLSGDDLCEWIAWLAAAAGFRTMLARTLSGPRLAIARSLPSQ